MSMTPLGITPGGFLMDSQTMTEYDLNLGDTYDIHIAENIPYNSVDFTWLDANDDPVDFTDCTAELRIGVRGQRVNKVILTSTSGITLAAAGVFRFTLTANQTLGLGRDDYEYDLDIFDSGGNPTRILRGAVICDPYTGSNAA